jgi:hypothetical protein
LDGTLIAVHYYTFFVSSPYNSETQWANGIASLIGSYAGRTIATEWGAPMSTGSKNGVEYDPIDYSIPSGSFFADYVRGVSSELRTLGVGSVYWPGLRDGDWYSLTSKTGTGSSIALSLVNASGLTRLHYAWDIGSGGGTYVTISNDATGLDFDGLGSTTSGSNVVQSSSTGSTDQQWDIINDGNYVLFENRATSMYIDGMGRTSSGSDLAQYAYSNSTNQQWKIAAAS